MSECAVRAGPSVVVGLFSEVVGLLRPPRRVGVSEWADGNRRLDARTSAEPGPFRTSRTPYLREVMDAFSDPSVRRIVLKCCSQVGKTTCLQNMLGYAIDVDPGPALFVLPTETAARQQSQERINPMFDSSPALGRHLTGVTRDRSALKYHLDSMTVLMAWAESPTTLASNPVRYVFLDECDKYPAFSGVEADPVKLAEERTKTFSNSVIVLVSTPTTQRGYVSREYAQTDRRHYWVPCPRCGEFQALMFAQLKWPQGEWDGDVIAERGLAWYECGHCGAALREHDKGGMLRRGVWVAEGETTDASGEIEEAEAGQEDDGSRVASSQSTARPTGHGDGADGSQSGSPAGAGALARPTGNGDEAARSRRGFHLNVLCSPWVTWSATAGEFVRSRGKPATLMNFVNSWLGEEWKDTSDDFTLEDLEGVCEPYREGLVPSAAQWLTAGVDTQKGYLRYVVRAWGYGDESWRVAQGAFVEDHNSGDWAKAEHALLNTQWPRAGGGSLGVLCVAVDSGYRTREVYAWERKWRGRVIACKGVDTGDPSPWKVSMITRDAQGRTIRHGQKIHLVNVGYYKDLVQLLRRRKPPVWHVYRGVGLEYLRECTAEHKVLVHNRRVGTATEMWVLREEGMANHAWDCEVLAAMAADRARIFNASVPPDGETVHDEPGGSSTARGGMTMPDGRPYLVTER